MSDLSLSVCPECDGTGQVEEGCACYQCEYDDSGHRRLVPCLECDGTGKLGRTDRSAYPWKVDDDYPCKARTPGGEWLHFDDLLMEGQKVGHSDGEGGVFGPFGVVVRRDDGLWIEGGDA